MSKENNHTNQLPKDWKWVKLGEVCKLKNGFAFKSTEYRNEGVAVIRISDIKYGNVKPDKSVRVNEQKDYDEYVVQPGEILVAMSGATTGKFGIYKSLEKAYQNQRVGKFQILNKEKLDDEFLLYQLHALKRQIEKDAYGGAQPNISSGKIEAMEILLPPKPIQQAIVSKIEELFSELDKGIEQMKTAQQQLKTYRQAVLKWAFEGKLTNENVKEGELPKGWKWVKISEIAKIETGTTPSKSNHAFYGNEYPFYKPTDLEAGENVFKSTDGLTKLGVGAARYVPENSTLVTCIGATIGKTGLIKKGGGFNQQINAIVPKENMNPKFIYYQTIGLYFQKQILDNASATTLPIINKGKFQILEMAVCPIEEQNKIVQAIESRLSVADKMEETISQSLQQAEALRQSILKKAFEGRLV